MASGGACSAAAARDMLPQPRLSQILANNVPMITAEALLVHVQRVWRGYWARRQVGLHART